MQYLSMSLKEIPINGNIVIYGNGKRGQDYYKIISTCRPDVTIVCFLDSFTEDRSSFPPTLKASTANLERYNVETILICSNYHLDIVLHLKELGIIPSSSISAYLVDWFVDIILPVDEAKKCEEMFKLLLEKLPDESFVYDALIRLEIQRNNFDLAFSYYKQAQDKFSNNIWDYVGYAKALGEMSRYAEAEELYQTIISQFPEELIGYSGYAGILKETARHAEAEELYRSIMERFPDDSAGYLGCASVFHNVGRYAEAEELYRSIMERFPNTPAAYLGCARVFRKTKRHGEAGETCRAGIEKFPENLYLRLAYLDDLLTLNKTDEFDEQCEIAFTMFGHQKNALRRIVGRRLYKKNALRWLQSLKPIEILVVGDSHSSCTFQVPDGKRMLVAANHSASMTGFSRDASRLNSFGCIKDMVEELSPSLVVFKFGQVDIEFVFDYKTKHKKLDMKFHDFSEMIIKAYVNRILSLQKLHTDTIFCVCGVNPPSATCPDSAVVKTQGDLKTRTKRALFFNSELKKSCDENELVYFDLCDYLLCSDEKVLKRHHRQHNDIHARFHARDHRYFLNLLEEILRSHNTIDKAGA